MDIKSKEKGILKLEPRQRSTAELTPQVSYERPPSSPQPSVDRLSVTWADPGSMTSSGVNLFHLPSETVPNNEVKFSPLAGDESEDEDYSVSLSAILRQRRASVRRSRKGRARRPSSPFLPDDSRPRRRSSVFTTSSGDTAISIDDQPMVTQEQIFENIHLHKEVLGSVKQQPLGMRRKLKIVNQAKGYIKRHEGQLQERLAQSKSTKNIYARFNILLATKWQQLKREAANTSNLLIPWELRIKEIESHFGSVVASYFTFLRWLFWVNLVIGFILLVFVIIPECLTANPSQDGERKVIMDDEVRNSTNLLTLWEFEGVLKYSPIFYGYYSNVERKEYRMPLAYFLTGLVVYIYSFVAILRKMAENSRMSKLSEKEDECIFSWKLFTGWDYMIGNAETAHNRIASVILGFKEALLEEAEKKKKLRNWRIISLRTIVNICVIVLLVVSAYAVVYFVSRSDDNPKFRNWFRENETTIVVTVISITFPYLFEVLGFLEHYHPRKQLRLQLARIMLLNLLNLYSLIFALFSKIEGMSKDLVSLQPTLDMNATIISHNVPSESEFVKSCFEMTIPCVPCDMLIALQIPEPTSGIKNIKSKKNKRQNDSYNRKIYTKNIYEKYNTYRSTTLGGTSSSEENHITSKKRIMRNIKENLMPNQPTTELSTDAPEEDYTDTKIFSSQTPEFTTDVNLDYEYAIDTTNSLFSSTNTNLETFSSELPSSTVSSDYKSTTDYKSIEDIENLTAWTDLYMSSDLNYFSTRNYDLFDFFELDSTTSTANFLDTSKPTSKEATDGNTDINFENNLSSTNWYSKPSSTSVTTKELSSSTTTTSTSTDISRTLETGLMCANITFNCSIKCGDKNITKIFIMSNCKIVDTKCYITRCNTVKVKSADLHKNVTNSTITDIAFMDIHNRKMYNLSIATKKKLLKLCWETMFGQELVKLTMMDLVFVLLGTLFLDFFRALFVRYMNRWWCWNLEKKFPEYGDFKIAENILHLINNQGMVWMGMFFSPGLVILNIFKLMIMMYLRSWAVMTCNVPHEVVFRVSKSNNFYLALLLTMLFLCVLPVGYTIVWVTPSWHCGPFSEYDRIYKILTSNIYKILPKSLNFTLEYIASPAIVIPLLVLLILIIYYLTSLTNSLREANNDLKIQLRRERTEERRKMFQLADTRRRGGSSSIDNTPFARWKKALPSLPITKSIDSDDRNTSMKDNREATANINKKGGIFAKIVGLAVDKKSNEEPSPNILCRSPNIDEETNFHESLPKDILKAKDIVVHKKTQLKKKSSVEFKTGHTLHVQSEKLDNDDEKDAMTKKLEKYSEEEKFNLYTKIKDTKENISDDKNLHKKQQASEKLTQKKQSSDSSNFSKNNDSIGSVIPVITISTTESDDEMLQTAKKDNKTIENMNNDIQNKANESEIYEKSCTKQLRRNKKFPDLKSLKRQNSVDSINEKNPKEKDTEDSGHKYQYSL